MVSALERIIGIVAGATPFILTICLDKSSGWAVGTALWGLAVIIFVGVKVKTCECEKVD